MSTRGRSLSPRPVGDEGRKRDREDESEAIQIKNLSRNVGETHLRAIFGCYGDISKINIPIYFRSGQSRGTATLVFLETSAAAQATSHMDGGSIDGLTVTVESTYASRSPSPPSRSPRPRAARDDLRSRKDHSRSPARSWSRSRTRSPPRRRPLVGRPRSPPFVNVRRDGRGGRRPFAGPRRSFRGRSRSRSYSPVPRRVGRRRSPSYERGGLSRGDRKGRSFSRSYSRSRSPYSARSSRSRTRSWSSRSRTRSRSYTPISSRGRTASSRSRSRSTYNRERTRSLTPGTH